MSDGRTQERLKSRARPDRRAFLRRAAAVGAAAAMPAGALAEAADPDPVFPAIEAHRAAWAAYQVAADRAWETIRPRPGTKEAADRAYEASVEVMGDLLETSPTTIAGLRAVLAYVFAREGEPLSMFLTRNPSLIVAGPPPGVRPQRRQDHGRNRGEAACGAPKTKA